MARKEIKTETGDPAAAEVQEVVEAEQEKGFRGVEVDPTPNEAYTVAGVTSGQPTPETDKDTAEEARRGVLAAGDVASGEDRR